jgi:glycine/D-amino acid oxidase-like deaminating enzyme
MENNFKDTFRPFCFAAYFFSLEMRIFALPHRRSYDTVIVGGAAVGSSIAYFLSNLRGGKKPSILVVEKDTSYKFSATALCAASYRTQFSTPENIRMSLFGAHFFRGTHYLSATGIVCYSLNWTIELGGEARKRSCHRNASSSGLSQLF